MGWLAYISRTHLSVRISRGGMPGGDSGVPPPPTPCGGTKPMLNVENLSANAILLNGYHLMKGQSGCIVEGGTLAFVAKPSSGLETEFLRFTLRRARGNVD